MEEQLSAAISSWMDVALSELLAPQLGMRINRNTHTHRHMYAPPSWVWLRMGWRYVVKRDAWQVGQRCIWIDR